MEQLSFSVWLKSQSPLNAAGDGYFSLSELSKNLIDDAVNRYTDYIMAFLPKTNATDFDRGFLAGWEARQKEYILQHPSPKESREECKHLNMNGNYCMDCGFDKTGNYY